MNVWINYVTSEVKCLFLFFLIISDVNCVAQDKLYHLTAFDQVVTVVEPEVSIFNYQVYVYLIATFLFVNSFS